MHVYRANGTQNKSDRDDLIDRLDELERRQNNLEHWSIVFAVVIAVAIVTAEYSRR
jgi:hypothetical protein